MAREPVRLKPVNADNLFHKEYNTQTGCEEVVSGHYEFYNNHTFTQVWEIQKEKNGHDVDVYCALNSRAFEESTCEGFGCFISRFIIDSVELSSLLYPMKLTGKILKRTKPNADAVMVLENLLGEKFYLFIDTYKRTVGEVPVSITLLEGTVEFEKEYWYETEDFQAEPDCLQLCMECLEAVQEFVLEKLA
jgi:hypothetical protein